MRFFDDPTRNEKVRTATGMIGNVIQLLNLAVGLAIFVRVYFHH